MQPISNEIWHGDALELVEKLPDPIHCLITDPPYGVNYVSRKAATNRGKKYVNEIANDGDLGSAIDLFLDVATPIVEKMADDSDLYVFTRWDILAPWVDAVQSLPGVKYKMLLVWDKGDLGMGDIDSNWGCSHELIIYAKKGRREVGWRRSSIIAVDRVHASRHIHPTEKPVTLLEYFVKMSTDPGDLVVDPFSGSGSTSVAAMNLGRSSIGIEKDERYIGSSRSRLDVQTLF